jgi:hypothetical protein
MENESRDGSGVNRKWLGAILWVVAVALMLGAAYYQRRTGPSHPVRGTFAVAGESYQYRLVRNALTTGDARVAIPEPAVPVRGELRFKRYRTDDEFTAVPLRPVDGELVGLIPSQPAAGKIEYQIVLDAPGGVICLPEPGTGNAVLRFKDPVPLFVLLPHISLMFVSMVLGLRTGLAALFTPARMRRLAWITLSMMTVGGLILGPIAQKYAFGAFWTGFPFGYDLTDNKVLIMWLVWLAACMILGFRPRSRERLARAVTAVAALVVVVVYAIPHSAQGSELDWDRVDRGVPPAEAIKTGAQGT